MSDLAFGVIGVVLVSAAFASQLRRPERTVAPLHQIALVIVALAVAAVACGAYLGLAGAAFLLLPLAVVVALHPTNDSVLRPPSRPSPLLLGTALVASVPTTIYASRMASAGRAGLPPKNSFAFVDSHWSALVAVAVASALVALLSALRFPGWTFSAGCVAVAALLFGCASIINPDITGSGGRGWGAAAVVWSVVWLSVALRERRHQAR
jgi:hypothetical protein